MSMPLSRRTSTRAAILAAGLCAAVPSTARSQTAGDLYTATLAQEAVVRAAASAALTDLRAIARAYEAIVRKFPVSSHVDDALWHAAGVETLAFERFSDPADEQRAQQLLEWLQKEYPYSSLAKKAALSLADRKAAAPVPTGAAAAIRSISRSALPRGERITVEFNQEVTYSGDRIPGPDRVYFDFRNATASSSVVEPPQSGAGKLIKSVRVAAHDDRTTRLVLELADTPRYSVFRLYDPFRLVIDVETEAPAPALSAQAPAPRPPPVPVTVPADPIPALSVAVAPIDMTTSGVDLGYRHPRSTPEVAPLPPAITSRGDYSLGRQLGLGISRVVIDPGHGGHDPGAQANGIDEAELVLDIALRVEKLLKDEQGFNVVLTRRTDDYVGLEERTAIANRESADLFLSIHANASREPTVRGIETYYLNFATTPVAEAVAARENATSAKTMSNLPDIVKAIALNNKVAESREVAAIVQSTLTGKLSGQNNIVRDLGVKQAPFVVLIGAQMPSVLAEISFLTNRNEAALLKQSAYRQRIAQALFDSVVKYRTSLKRSTSVAAKGDRK
jgi:N-acetylmuramoyl-L-alanine amidase